MKLLKVCTRIRVVRVTKLHEIAIAFSGYYRTFCIIVHINPYRIGNGLSENENVAYNIGRVALIEKHM